MAYEQLIKSAEDFIAKRALTHVGAISPQPVVHIVKVRGAVELCRAQLAAPAFVARVRRLLPVVSGAQPSVSAGGAHRQGAGPAAATACCLGALRGVCCLLGCVGHARPALSSSHPQPCLLPCPPPSTPLQYEIDTDSIGNVVCKKAEELQAAVTVLARHSKSRLQEFFLGSVSN